MVGPVEFALMVGPLSLYFLGLAVCYACRGPRVIAGPVDSGLLGVALGSLIAFGPIGRALTAGLPGGPAKGPLLLFAVVAGLGLSGRARRRLAIYNVEPGRLEPILREILAGMPGTFTRTLDGFEDRAARTGLTVEGSAQFRVAEVVASGAGAEALIAAIAPELRRHLRSERARGMPLARLWLSVSSLALTAPLSAYLLSRPQARAALRILFERLRGG